MKRIYIIVILLVCAGVLRAQEEPQYLSLDSCTARALRNQAAVRNALLDVEMARETRKAAFTKYFPSLSAMAGGFRSQYPLVDVSAKEQGDKLKVSAVFDGRELTDSETQLQQLLDMLGADIDVSQLVQDFTDRFAFDARLQMLQEGVFANVMLTQPVFAGGRILNGNRLAEVGVRAAELQLLMTSDEVALNTEQRYWQIVSLNEKLRTVVQVQQLLDTLERDAQAACNAGVLGRNDLLKVRLKKSEMRSSQLQLTNGIALATAALCQYIGMPEECRYRFDTIDYCRILPPQGYKDPDSAYASRSEGKLLEAGVEAARLQKAMVLGEALPQVAVGATYGANNLMGDAFSRNGMVFATVSVPLTAWWETAHKVRKEELACQQAVNRRDDLRQLMQLQTRQAWNELCEAYDQIEVKRQACADAQENLTEVKHYYDAGMSSMGDYLEAQTLLQQARNELTDQIIAYQLKNIRYLQLAQ